MFNNVYLNNDTTKLYQEWGYDYNCKQEIVTVVRPQGMLCMGWSWEGCWSAGSDFVLELGSCYTACLLKVIHFTPLFGVPFLYVC